MAHLVDRVNSLHDPVLQKLEIAQFDRVVDTVVLQVFVPKTLLWAACWWIWQCLFSNLTVNAVVPATVCRSMSEILHSPVATLNVADLKNYHFDWGLKEKSKLDGDVFFWFQISLFAEEWQQVCIYGVASVVMRHLLHLLQPAAFSWRNSKKWISSASPPAPPCNPPWKDFEEAKKFLAEGRTWGEKITWGASSWWGKKLLMGCKVQKVWCDWSDWHVISLQQPNTETRN